MSDIIGAAIASSALLSVSVPRTTPPQQPVKMTWQDWVSGLHLLGQDRALVIMLLADALAMSLYAPLASLYPLMTSGYFHLSALFGSAVELSFALGMIGSSLLFATRLTIRKQLHASRWGLAGMGVFAALGGLMPAAFGGWLGFAISCLGLAAAGNLHSISLATYIQTNIAPDTLGRVLSIQTTINGLTMPIGLVVASPIATVIGVNHWFLIAGLGILGCFGVASLALTTHTHA
jgi:DHA3 family macrolide efflux protein-like MFS transporter